MPDEVNEYSIAELQSQLAELGEQLEFDRSLVADCLTKARKAVASRDWLTEGRGCYEWNDDRWHEEFRHAANEFLIALEPMSKSAHDWSGCPKSGEEIAKARRNLKDQLAIARLERDNRTSAYAITVKQIGELRQQLAASQERERIMREALESMRRIYENQQMSTLTVAKTMLQVSMDALKEASAKSQPSCDSCDVVCDGGCQASAEESCQSK